MGSTRPDAVRCELAAERRDTDPGRALEAEVGRGPTGVEETADRCRALVDFGRHLVVGQS